MTPLPHRAAACLDVLLEADGQPVSREALHAAVWGDAVVENSNLSHSILLLRKTLGTTAEGHDYIETVPRVGYRLTVPVMDVSATRPHVQVRDAEATARVDERTVSSTTTTDDAGRQVPWRRWVAGIAFIAAIGTTAWTMAGRSAPPERDDVAEMVGEGLRLIRRGNYQDGVDGTAFFDRAMQRAPGRPLVVAAMAEAAARLGKEEFGTAIDLARQAVAADPACGECQAILGYVLMTRFWEWDQAADHLDRAMKLGADGPQTLSWRALWRAVHGQLEEAAADAERAVRLAPTDASAHAELAMVHFFAGRHAEALKAGARAVQLNPGHAAPHYWRMRTFMQLGEDGAAANTRAEHIAAWNGLDMAATHDYQVRFSSTRLQRGLAGLIDVWLEEMSEGGAKASHRYERAVWQMWVGRPDAALDELEGAVIDRPYYVIYSAVDPMFAPLRAFPRFQAVVAKLGLAVEPGDLARP